jgi:integral membrane protein
VTFSTALGRYRIMANVVGVMLIAVFICLIPAINSIDAVLGPIHGALYIVYLFTVLQLWIERRLGLLTVAAMVSAGWVPFVAFIVERWVTRQITTDPSASHSTEPGR